MAAVRSLVRDVDEAIAFYTEGLGFGRVRQFGPAMAMLRRGELTLWLAGPLASAAKPMPDGRRPEPGGWNRFVLEVDNLDAVVASLRERGTPFRNEILAGSGGRQILCEDPSGNPMELFQSAEG
jgi:catechol 2,3-dioxygenase-like lactoylglutathione lyase family enzyme